MSHLPRKTVDEPNPEMVLKVLLANSTTSMTLKPKNFSFSFLETSSTEIVKKMM
jgi:hypothetical protein